ncbi:MAG: hypothetical protein HQL87_00730 [Magnetococcales bacterium]|nr:hypothetical protein [Magnetococcales bacterium]
MFRVSTDQQLKSNLERMVKRSPKPRDERTSGFTLVEIMIAGSLGTVLCLILFQILMQAQHMADVMIMQSTLNSQAREVFELLMDGGVNVQAGVPNPIPGYHDSSSDPFPNLLSLPLNADAAPTRKFQLRLGLAAPAGVACVADDAAICTRETLPTFGITCTDQNTPVKACVTNWPAQTTYTVDGYIDIFHSTSPSAGITNTSEVAFTIIDPQQVPRPGVNPLFTQAEYSASYWTAFSLNRN